MMLLKQSTTITIRIGPALDKTDGVTEETGLTPTVKVSKNGGVAATRNSATATSHDANGWYRVELDATDTNTLGRLQVSYQDSATHLPVWQEYMVVPANVWDSLVGGTDNLEVDETLISGDAIAANNAESFFDGTGYAGTNNIITTTARRVEGVIGINGSGLVVATAWLEDPDGSVVNATAATFEVLDYDDTSIIGTGAWTTAPTEAASNTWFADKTGVSLTDGMAYKFRVVITAGSAYTRIFPFNAVT